MDCRNIEEEAPEVKGGLYLEEMYKLQNDLLSHYQVIEHLPKPPINVNSKSDQIMIKDFIGRVIEEIAEGYESWQLIWEILNKNKFWINEELEGNKEYEQCLNHLQNFNEEMADAMHFMLELLIYTNIQPEDIKTWLVKRMEEVSNDKNVLESFKESTNLLERLMHIGEINNAYSWEVYRERVVNIYRKSVDGYESYLPYIPAGNKISGPKMDSFRLDAWDVAQSLNIARNCLKNKPWKQTGVMTDETMFQSNIVESLVYLMGLFKHIGFTPESLYQMYFKKNKVNQFRIKSKY